VAIGGRAYYAASAELSVSVGGFFEKFGLQPSLFVDAGSVFGAKSNRLLPGEQLFGNSAKPRVSAGVGLAMKTPAGTLRLDFARALVKQSGDRTQAFTISFGAAI
jgi:outer membrane protein assembly factor BamA